MNLSEQQEKVQQVRRSLRFVWGTLILSMGYVSYVLFHALTHPVSPGPALQVAAVLAAAMSFVLPALLQRKLRVSVANPLDTALGKLMVTHIVRFAFTEAAMILLILSNPKPGIESTIAIFGCACVLMIFHFPTDARIAAALREAGGGGGG